MASTLRPGVPVYAKLEARFNQNDISRRDEFRLDLRTFLEDESRMSNKSHAELHELGIKLCSRLFGDEHAPTTTSKVPDSRWVEGTVKGGWLKSLSTRYSQTKFTDKFHSIDTFDDNTKAILENLLPNSRFMELMSAGGLLEVPIRLDTLTIKAQIRIRTEKYYECIRSANQAVYFPPYFKTHSNEQHQPLLRYSRDNPGNAKMMIKFLEFYFVSFFRYPKQFPGVLSISKDAEASRPISVHSSLVKQGIFALIDENAYASVLYETLNRYIKHSPVVGMGNPSSSKAVDDESLTIAGQMFVRLLAEFWMESPMLVRDKYKLGLEYRAKITKSIKLAHANPDNIIWKTTELLTLNDNMSPTTEENSGWMWSVGAVGCTYIALVRMLSDPNLCQQYDNLCQKNLKAKTTLPSSLNSTPNKSQFFTSIAIVQSAVCPNALSLVQQPLFDMIRTIFHKADTTYGDNISEVYALTVECWLLWIQPWKAADVAKGVPLGKSAAQYDAALWKPYIAANLHFYTTLLAIFFQKCDKTDFSAGVNNHIHIDLLEKVLLAFEPLNDLLFSVEKISGGGGGIGMETFSNFKGLVKKFHVWYDKKSPKGPLSQSFQPSSPQDAVKDEALMLSIESQHRWLYPDVCVDDNNKDEEKFGIVNVVEYFSRVENPAIARILFSLQDYTTYLNTSSASAQASSGTLSNLADMVDAVHALAAIALMILFVLIISQFPKSYLALWYSRKSVDVCYFVAFLCFALKFVTAKYIPGPYTLKRALGQLGWGADKQVKKSGEIDRITAIKDKLSRLRVDSGNLGSDSPRSSEGQNPNGLAPSKNRDVLYLPVMSTEVDFVAAKVIDLSKKLNEAFHLPAKGDAASWTWSRAFSDQALGMDAKVMFFWVVLASVSAFNAWFFSSLMALLAVCAASYYAYGSETFRFNLRFLADVRVNVAIWSLVAYKIVYPFWEYVNRDSYTLKFWKWFMHPLYASLHWYNGSVQFANSNTLNAVFVLAVAASCAAAFLKKLFYG